MQDDMAQLAEALGFDFPPDRRAAILAAFMPIAAEIAKLRSLDLTDVHPAVVFSPCTQNPTTAERRR
jgi:hypothetical protein